MKSGIIMVIIGLLLLFAWFMIYIKTGSIIALIGAVVVSICIGANITVALADCKRKDK